MRESIRRLADYCWRNLLQDGVSRRLTDHLHAFEEGTNIQPPLTLLYYGDPEYVERLMKAHRVVADHVTGVNPQGDRLFRSHFFSATEIREDVGYDNGMCLVFSPSRYLAWYNGAPEAVDLLASWQRSFFRRIDKAHGPNLYGKKGWLAIDYKTGEPRPGDGPSGMDANMYCLIDVTGDKTLMEPVFEFWRQGKSPVGFSVLSWASWRKIMAEPEIEQALKGKADEVVAASPALAWRMGLAGKERLVEALKDDLTYVRKYRPLLTWVGQSADRVRINQQLMATLFLGGMADKAKRLNYHYHAVSWEGADGDVARMVVEDTRARLKVLIYSFHAAPRKARMRVWRLDHGLYRVRAGVDADGDDAMDAAGMDKEMELARYSAVEFEAPPRQVLVVEVDQVKALDDIRRRADLAIGPADTGFGKGGLRVVVHNIGGAGACGGRVQVERGGQVVAARDFPALEAPRDMKPSRAEVLFPDVTAGAGLIVRLVPNQPLPEITQVNNALDVRP